MFCNPPGCESTTGCRRGTTTAIAFGAPAGRRYGRLSTSDWDCRPRPEPQCGTRACGRARRSAPPSSGTAAVARMLGPMARYRSWLRCCPWHSA
jgi:hypothetical protein